MHVCVSCACARVHVQVHLAIEKVCVRACMRVRVCVQRVQVCMYICVRQVGVNVSAGSCAHVQRGHVRELQLRQK